MSDDEAKVLIESEGRTQRWGQDSYLKAWNGLKLTANERTIKSLMLPLALAIVAIAYLGKRDDTVAPRGQEIRAPSVAAHVPVIESHVFTEKDMRLPVQREKRLAASQTPVAIQIVHLKSLGDIPVGSEARAILESGATNGIVKARLLAPLIVDGEPILPERTIIFGRGQSTEERLFVEFTKAVFASGETLRFRAQAFDGGDKILGLKGAFVGTKTRKMLWGAGLGFVGGMASGLQTPTAGSIFAARERPTVQDAALAGASKAALDQSQATLEEMRNARDIVEVKKGTEFYLITDEAAENGKESK